MQYCNNQTFEENLSTKPLPLIVGLLFYQCLSFSLVGRITQKNLWAI